jgi:CBS domain-containing protein
LRVARPLRDGKVMARTVQEIMNRELFAIRPELPVTEVRGFFRSLHVGAAPVLDGSRRPLGVLSVRDVLDGDGTAGERMTKPAICVGMSTSIEEAARRLAHTSMHHLIVVDGAGAAVGMVSTLDFLRALLGMPAHHPDTFPHWDEATHVSWTDDWALDDENLPRAPAGPGVLVLVRANAGDPDEPVWVEASPDVRARLHELTEAPVRQPTVLARMLALRGLRFRAATVGDQASRDGIVALLRDRLDHQPPPGAT